MNVFLLLSLAVESALLFLLEKKMWKTVYTPLNFLMIPYLAVLGFTLVVAGHGGMADFYYPSLVPWIIGLPLFAVPGWLFFLAERRKKPAAFVPDDGRIPDGNPVKGYRFKIIVALSIVVFLGVRLAVLLAQDRGVVGNEAFGDLFAGHGWAGHALMAGTAVMMWLLFEDKRLLTWIVAILILFFLFVYQVKSWIILPLLTVFSASLLSGRIKPAFRHLFWICATGILVFFASFLLIYLSGDDTLPQATTLGGQMKSIGGLFVHYVTSGTLGLSLDMRQGILEEPDLQHVLTPLYNFWYLVTGQPIVSGRNTEFLYTGITGTNVRSFFGTLFIFTKPWGFAICTLLYGTACHFFFRLFRQRKTSCALLLYAWVCMVSAMGWFDFLPYLSNVFEIPFWIFIIDYLQNLCLKFDIKRSWKYFRS